MKGKIFSKNGVEYIQIAQYSTILFYIIQKSCYLVYKAKMIIVFKEWEVGVTILFLPKWRACQNKKD